MITNERQRRLAEAQLRSFEAAVRGNEARPPSPGVDPRLHRAMRDAAASEALELRAQLQHYEDLLAGRLRVGYAATADELPQLLVEARIASGWSQREVAARLDVDEEQVERWETDGYDGASAEIVQRAAELFGARVGETVAYLPEGPTAHELRRRLGKAGVPDDLVARLEHQVEEHDRLGAASRGFAWLVDDLALGVPQEADLPLRVLFKSTKRQAQRTTPLVRLAHTVARIAASVVYPSSAAPVPADPAELRASALDEEGQVTLSSLLAWSWNSAIPVLPLVGRGGFAASVWNVEERPVAVLKRGNAEAAYWLFDLAHELGHVACGHLVGAGLVDVTPPLGQAADEQERDANAWALDLLLPEHRSLMNAVRAEIGSRPPHLEFKFAVERVAQRAGASAGLLGLVAAFELTDLAESKDRWGSATNLAKEEGPGRPVVEAFARSRLPLRSLARIDRQLMEAVLFSGPGDDFSPGPGGPQQPHDPTAAAREGRVGTRTA